jgi:hypothetical protein
MRTEPIDSVDAADGFGLDWMRYCRAQTFKSLLIPRSCQILRRSSKRLRQRMNDCESDFSAFDTF